MQIDQILRRLSWRLRRRFRKGADNDPIVSIEPSSPRPPVRTPTRRQQLARAARTATGFVATLVVLAAAYGLMVAIDSRATLDVGAEPEVAAGASHAVAAAAALLAPETEAPAPPLAPSGRLLREGRLHDGAADVAARFVALAGPARGRTDPALAAARAALPVSAPSGAAERATARDALLRFNTRVARGEAQLDTGRAALAALVLAAAESCERESAMLAGQAREPSFVASPAADARMYEARGVAWGWLLILRGSLQDAPDAAKVASLEATIPLEALTRAASREPIVLFNGGKSAPWAPAHIADEAADFSRAAAGARALATAIARSPS